MVLGGSPTRKGGGRWQPQQAPPQPKKPSEDIAEKTGKTGTPVTPATVESVEKLVGNQPRSRFTIHNITNTQLKSLGAIQEDHEIVHDLFNVPIDPSAKDSPVNDAKAILKRINLILSICKWPLTPEQTDFYHALWARSREYAASDGNLIPELPWEIPSVTGKSLYPMRPPSTRHQGKDSEKGKAVESAGACGDQTDLVDRAPPTASATQESSHDPSGDAHGANPDGHTNLNSTTVLGGTNLGVADSSTICGGSDLSSDEEINEVLFTCPGWEVYEDIPKAEHTASNMCTFFISTGSLEKVYAPMQDPINYRAYLKELAAFNTKLRTRLMVIHNLQYLATRNPLALTEIEGLFRAVDLAKIGMHLLKIYNLVKLEYKQWYAAVRAAFPQGMDALLRNNHAEALSFIREGCCWVDQIMGRLDKLSQTLNHPRPEYRIRYSSPHQSDTDDMSDGTYDEGAPAIRAAMSDIAAKYSRRLYCIRFHSDQKYKTPQYSKDTHNDFRLPLKQTVKTLHQAYAAAHERKMVRQFQPQEIGGLPTTLEGPQPGGPLPTVDESAFSRATTLHTQSNLFSAANRSTNYGTQGLGSLQTIFAPDRTSQIFSAPVNCSPKQSSASYLASTNRFELEERRMAQKPSYDSRSRTVYRKTTFVPPTAIADFGRQSAINAAANLHVNRVSNDTFSAGGGVTASGNSGGRDNRRDQDRQDPQGYQPANGRDNDREDDPPPNRENGPPHGAGGGGGGGGGGDSDPSDDGHGNGGWYRGGHRPRRNSPHRHYRGTGRESRDYPPRDTRDAFELYFNTLEEELQFYRDQFNPPWNDHMPRTIGKRDSERKQIQNAFKSNLFSGKEVEFPKWKTRQINEIHLANLSFKDKFEETLNSLDPSDKTLAEMRKMDDATPMGYAYLIETLEKVYGGDDKTMQALKRDIIDLGKIRFNDYHSVIRASLRLKSYFTHCEKFHLSMVYMSQDTELELMGSLLTESDGEAYLKWRIEHGKDVGLKSLHAYFLWRAKLKKENSVLQQSMLAQRYKAQSQDQHRPQTGYRPSGYRYPTGQQPPARALLGEAEEEYYEEELEYDDPTGYHPDNESDEEAEVRQATAFVAGAFHEANEPGEYTEEEEIDEYGQSSHLQYEGYMFTALNTSHGCKMGCPAKHMLVSCPVWLALSATDKKTRVFALGLCCNCFSSSHRWRECPKHHACDRCDQPHHRSLHSAYADLHPVRREALGRGGRGQAPRGRGHTAPSRRPFGNRPQGRGGQRLALLPPVPPPPRRRD